MARTMNLVVTCTQRKKLASVDRLRVGSLRQSGIKGRVDEWRGHLALNGVPTRPARDLYAGDSWTVVRRLSALEGARTWVCSAGYGLVSIGAPLAGYAATFSPGHEDSVSGKSDTATRTFECQQWWAGVSKWVGPEAGAVRSLTALARQHSRTPMLFAGSESYLRALQVDLAEAGRILGDRLIVISAGSPELAGLQAHQLPCDARFQAEVGGARQSLNVRILERLLEEVSSEDLDVPHATDAICAMSENLEPLKKFDREPMTDDQVRDFINKEREANPKAKHSPLLRKLRDTGHRCEQSRFKQLFTEEAQRHGG